MFFTVINPGNGFAAHGKLMVRIVHWSLHKFSFLLIHFVCSLTHIFTPNLLSPISLQGLSSITTVNNASFLLAYQSDALIVTKVAELEVTEPVQNPIEQSRFRY